MFIKNHRILLSIASDVGWWRKVYENSFLDSTICRKNGVKFTRIVLSIASYFGRWCELKNSPFDSIICRNISDPNSYLMLLGKAWIQISLRSVWDVMMVHGEEWILLVREKMSFQHSWHCIPMEICVLLRRINWTIK